MRGRWTAIFVVVLATLWPAFAVAQAVYVASFRNAAMADSNSIAGSLYALELGSSTANFIAPIRVDGVTPVGVTGLAIHPQTGVMFGITSSTSPNHRQSLITVDANTGRATVVGAMKQAGSDISFTRSGVLYTWLPEIGQLAILDTTNANLTVVGSPRGPGPPTGLAIDAKGTAYITSGGAGGTLDRIDLGSGQITPGPQMTGAPFPAGVNSMSFTPSGLLLAVNSNLGAPATTRLVSINIATGVVASMGNLPDDTDAISFAPQLHLKDEGWSLRGMMIAVLAVLSALVGAVAVWLGRRGRAS